MDIQKMIDEIYPELVAIRRDLHQHPELSEQEVRTSKVICKYLKENKIDYKSGYAIHGVVGLIQGNEPGKTVAIRADMDALPIQEVREIPYRSIHNGVMHACGHDVHTTILLGTAKILQNMRSQLQGNVKLLFQPAEETVGGAERMIKEGCMENPKVDYTVGLHVHSGLECGKISIKHGQVNAASGDVRIKVIGKAGHGAHPEEAVDAILIASQIVIALQTIVSRSISAMDAIVLTIGKIHGGNKTNIIADTVELEGTLRALDTKLREQVKEHIIRIAQSTAMAYGGRAEVTFEDSYIALVNCDEVVDVAMLAAIETVGKENVITNEPPSLGAEDFAYFCEASKGAFYSIGVANVEKGITASIHNEFFDVDEECIKIGIEMHLRTVMRLLDSDRKVL